MKNQILPLKSFVNVFIHGPLSSPQSCCKDGIPSHPSFSGYGPFFQHLIDDIPSQIDKVEHLFDLAEKGEVRLVTGPPVFFEMAWTLKSFYNMSRKRIYECLSSIIGLPGLEVTDLDILEEALQIFYHTSSDFSDAYIATSSKKVGAESVATFNAKHFKNLDVKLYPFK